RAPRLRALGGREGGGHVDDDLRRPLAYVPDRPGPVSRALRPPRGESARGGRRRGSYSSHFFQTSGWRSIQRFAASSGVSRWEAIISETSFWCCSDQWNFFRKSAASPPRSTKSALRNFCSGVVG